MEAPKVVVKRAPARKIPYLLEFDGSSLKVASFAEAAQVVRILTRTKGRKVTLSEVL